MKVGINKLGEYVDFKICAVVVVRAPITGKILYNSGKLYFEGKAQFKVFQNKIYRENRKAQVIKVFSKKAKSPSKFKIDEDELKKQLFEGKMFCPYCGCVEDWGTKDIKCPVCGISEEDFYVKTYNNSWKRGLDNAVR